MDRDEQFEVYLEADLRRRQITVEKSAEYTNESEDVLRNFKAIAERLGVHPLLVLAVYMNKHLDSVNTFIKRVHASPSAEFPDLVQAGEGIISRLDDARNYLDLAECLVIESMWQEHDKFLESCVEPAEPRFTNRGQGMCQGGCGNCGSAQEWPTTG